MRVAMRASVWRLANRMAQTGFEDIVGSCGAWFECGGKRLKRSASKAEVLQLL